MPFVEQLGLDGLAAGDFNPLRVHPAIVFGQQGGDHRADVVRKGGTSECGYFCNMAGNVRIVLYHTFREIRLDCTRRHCVDGNAARPKFLGHVMRHDFYRPFMAA